MTNKIYTIAVEVANEPTAVVSLNAARTAAQGPLKLIAKGGALYQLTEAATGFAPQQIQVRRKGKDLHISLEQNSPDRPDLVIENYFGVENAVVVGQAENGQHYPFIPDTARDVHAIDKLADGTTITQVLGGQVGPVPAAVAIVEPVGAVEASGAALGALGFNPLLLGGAAAAAAAAAGAGGGGGGDGGGGGGTDPTVQISTFDNDGKITKTEAELKSTPVSGTTTNTAGGNVEVVITDKDGREVPGTRKTVPVAANGTWSTTVDVSGAPDGALTAKAVAITAANARSPEVSKGAVKDTYIDPEPTKPNVDPNRPAGEADWTAKLDPASNTGSKDDSITANNRPTFSGTGEPGGKVEIALPDGTKASAIVNPNGTWTAPYPGASLPLPNGKQDLSTTITDPNGNTSTGLLPVEIVGPTVDLKVFDGVVTNPAQFINGGEQASVTLSGTTTNTTAGDRVSITVNGASGTPVVVTAIVNADGTWSTTANVSTLPEGLLTATATVSTTVEGIALTSRPDAETATKDTKIDPHPLRPSDPTKPEEPTGTDDWTAQIDPASDTGDKGDGTTANNRPTFSGKGEPGGTVAVTLPGPVVVTATVQPDGTWTMPYPANVPALPNGGPQNLPITITDPAGNSQTAQLPVTIVGPAVDIEVFDGNGQINAAEQTSVALSGTTTNAIVGDTVTIRITNGAGQPVEVTAKVTAIVNGKGQWSTTADVNTLPEGKLTATATVATTVEGLNLTSRPDTQDANKDTAAYRVVITHNAEALDGSNSIVGSKEDNKLNIAEAKGGVTYTLTFEGPVDTLTASDLQITNGSVRGSLQANADKTVWTVVVDPTPSNTGTLDLTLTSTKIATLKDAAGNPATVTTAAAVSHDTIAPVSGFTDNPSGSKTGSSTDLMLDTSAIFVLDGNETAANYVIGLTKAVVGDSITSVSFEGLGSASLTSQSTVTLNRVGATATDGLAALREGFYSLEVTSVDDAGNTSMARQIIGKNTGTFQSTSFVSTLDAGNTLTGDNNNNFVINRSGVDEIITLGGNSDRDTVFFLKTGLGTVGGSADRATIKDFNTNLNTDTLRLDDLFSGSATHNQIRFEGLDLDGNDTLESTRIYVNTTGGLNSANLAGTAEQIITLENVAFGLDTTQPFVAPTWLVL